MQHVFRLHMATNACVHVYRHIPPFVRVYIYIYIEMYAAMYRHNVYMVYVVAYVNVHIATYTYILFSQGIPTGRNSQKQCSP